MTIGLGALAVAAIFLVGYSGRELFAGLNGPLRVGFAYGVGLVWVSTLMGLMGGLGIPLTPAAGVLVIVAPPAMWWLRSRWRASQTTEPRRPIRWLINRDPWWLLGVTGLIVVWLMVVARAIVKPIMFWDAWATYGLKAKIIFGEASIPLAMAHELVASNYPNYPLGVSLQEVWVAWFVGSWDDVAVKLLFPAYLLAMWCLVYGALRERWSPRASLVGTVAVAGLPLLLQHGQDGYTDLPFAFFALASAVALTRYLSAGEGRALGLAAVCAAGLVWVRADGAILVALNAVLLVGLSVFRSGLRVAAASALWYLALPAVVWGAWALANLGMGITSDFPGRMSVGLPLLERAPIIGKLFFHAFFLSGNWAILWAVAALAVAFRFRNTLNRGAVFFIWPPVMYLLVVAWLFGTTNLFRFVADGTVLHRLILHVAPLVALGTLITLGRDWGVTAWSPSSTDANR